MNSRIPVLIACTGAADPVRRPVGGTEVEAVSPGARIWLTHDRRRGASPPITDLNVWDAGPFFNWSRKRFPIERAGGGELLAPKLGSTCGMPAGRPALTPCGKTACPLIPDNVIRPSREPNEPQLGKEYGVTHRIRAWAAVKVWLASDHFIAATGLWRLCAE